MIGEPASPCRHALASDSVNTSLIDPAQSQTPAPALLAGTDRKAGALPGEIRLEILLGIRGAIDAGTVPDPVITLGLACQGPRYDRRQALGQLRQTGAMAARSLPQTL